MLDKRLTNKKQNMLVVYFRHIRKRWVGYYVWFNLGLVFELRTGSQTSSEALQKIEIMERDFGKVQQELNQMRVNIDILEGALWDKSVEIVAFQIWFFTDLGSSESTIYQRLVWRITEVESKLQKAKESAIVLKSPIFYTHRYGYKIRVNNAFHKKVHNWNTF